VARSRFVSGSHENSCFNAFGANPFACLPYNVPVPLSVQNFGCTMNLPIYVAPPSFHGQQLPPAPSEVPELLRQMIELQKLQIELHKQQLANADDRAKWANFYSRWSGEFPELPTSCKKILPALERSYLSFMQDVTERLADGDADVLDNEFAISEFLDRYGIRLAQLGGILNQFNNMAGLAPNE